MPNGPDWLLAWLAATRIGALAVLLNTFARRRELAWALRHADVQVLLVRDRFLGQAPLALIEEAAPGLATEPAWPLHVPELPHLRAVHAWGDTGAPWARRAPEGLAEEARRAPRIDETFLLEVEAEVTPADAMVLIFSSGSAAEPKGVVHTHGAIIRHAANLNAFRALGPDDRLYSPMPFFWVGGLVYSCSRPCTREPAWYARNRSSPRAPSSCSSASA